MRLPTQRAAPLEVRRTALGEVFRELVPLSSPRIVVQMARMKIQPAELCLVVRREQVRFKLKADRIAFERLVAAKTDRPFRNSGGPLGDGHANRTRASYKAPPGLNAIACLRGRRRFGESKAVQERTTESCGITRADPSIDGEVSSSNQGSRKPLHFSIRNGAVPWRLVDGSQETGILSLSKNRPDISRGGGLKWTQAQAPI